MTDIEALSDLQVFTGPSLPPGEAQAILPTAACHGPAALGDIYWAATRHPRAIVLIDGYFENRPAVWHKELLWALHEGITVYGAASMGALRAVEMAPFGMTGIGQIFEAYRDGLLEDDDDVAVVHGPAELGYAPLTEAMVNVTATLEQAASDGILEGPLQQSLRTAAKSQHYRDRSWHSVIAQTRGAIGAARQLEAFERWLDKGAVNQKRADAMEALHRAQSNITAGVGHDEPAPDRDPPFLFEVNCFWDHITGRPPEPLSDGDRADICPGLLTDEDVVPEPYRTRALLRLLALTLAQRDGFRIDSCRLLEEFRRHAARFDLSSSAALQRWLAANGINRAGLHKLMEDNVLVESVITTLEPQMADALRDELRLSGDVPRPAGPRR